jgi:hypothetical protein
MGILKDFIAAYIYFFGGTKKQAIKVFKETDEYYHRDVIYGFKNNAKSVMYLD